MTLWFLGYADQAAQSARAGIDLAATLSHPPSVGHALWWAACRALPAARCGNGSRLRQRLIALGSEHGLQLYRAAGGIATAGRRSPAGTPKKGCPSCGKP